MNGKGIGKPILADPIKQTKKAINTPQKKLVSSVRITKEERTDITKSWNSGKTKKHKR